MSSKYKVASKRASYHYPLSEAAITLMGKHPDATKKFLQSLKKNKARGGKVKK